MTVRAIRISIIRDGRSTVCMLILQDERGDVEIVNEGRPRVDSDRSTCLRIGCEDVILSVEKAEL